MSRKSEIDRLRAAVEEAFEAGFQHAWDGEDWRPENALRFLAEQAAIVYKHSHTKVGP